MLLIEKQQFFLEMNKAFIERDIDFLSGSITDDVTWSLVGDRKIHGKTGFIDYVKSRKNHSETGRTIDRMIAEGLDISVTGTMKKSSKSGKLRIYAYHDIYRLTNRTNGKIRELTSFVMELKQ